MLTHPQRMSMARLTRWIGFYLVRICTELINQLVTKPKAASDKMSQDTSAPSL